MGEMLLVPEETPPGCAQLWRRPVATLAPLTAESGLLVRLTSVCSNRCPMCTNVTGGANLDLTADELLRRIERASRLGFRRVILTGGEPTLHPAFFEVVDAIRGRGLAWDMMTNGRTAANAALARRIAGAQPRRLIVSFHSHRQEVAAAMSGGSARTAEESIAGVQNLLAGGVRILLQCVLTRLNLHHLPELIEFVATSFRPTAGAGPSLMLTFPTLRVRDPGWLPLELRLGDLAAPLADALASGRRLGVPVVLRAVPNCASSDPEASDHSRFAVGTTHYLEDREGVKVYSLAWAESHLYVFAERCAGCQALSLCSGVQPCYVQRYGFGELSPL